MKHPFGSPYGMPAPVAVRWIIRPHPLPIAGAAGWGRTAVHLAERLLLRTDADLARLSGVASGDILIFTGPAEALPWTDGVRYLGHDPLAPSLLIPTTLTTSVPITLFERALRSRIATAASPVAVIPDRDAVISLSYAAPLSRTQLLGWLENNCLPGHRASIAMSREAD